MHFFQTTFNSKTRNPISELVVGSSERDKYFWIHVGVHCRNVHRKSRDGRKCWGKSITFGDLSKAFHSFLHFLSLYKSLQNHFSTLLLCKAQSFLKFSLTFEHSCWDVQLENPSLFVIFQKLFAPSFVSFHYKKACRYISALCFYVKLSLSSNSVQYLCITGFR